MPISQTLQNAYTTANHHAVYIPRPHAGHLWSAGQHRIDLIHRMSTNDLTNMAPNEGRATVLTDAVARIIDRIIVINLQDRALLLTSPGRAELLHNWLSRHIFFNDDMHLDNPGNALAQIDIYGPNAAKIVTQWLPDASNLPRYHAHSTNSGIIVRADPLAGGGFHFIAPPDTLTTYITALEAQNVVKGDLELFDILRVEAGLPGIAGEITNDHIPLEVGLWNDVSFTKGCYIGQEIIARMESRGQLAKTLVAIQSENQLTTGATLRGPAGERGILTSAIESPTHGWLGLGLIKPTAAQPGTQLTLSDHNQPAHVITLPIKQH